MPIDWCMDSAWIERIREGDAKAFERLFYTYAEALIRFARRYVTDVPTAENIVQDVFVSVWEKRSDLDSSKNIKTYLYVAVRNRAFSILRHEEVRRRGADTLRRVEASVRTPEELLNAKEIAKEVRLAVNALPERCRLVFSMNRYDGLTYREIAEIEGVSVKTVETQMGRAFKFLRNRLASLLTPVLF